MEAVEELKPERNQKRDEEKKKRDVVADLRAGRVNITVDAVGYEQYSGRQHAHEKNRRDRIDVTIKFRAVLLGGLDRARLMLSLPSQSPCRRQNAAQPL
jgi:hypothetical protein